MAVEYVQHIAQEGDRWDSLAYQYLGDAYNIGPIIYANPMIPLAPVIPAGAVVFIPVFDPQPLINFNNLPPWRRPQT
jgi:phage tail protein X